ncbi:MAG: dTMP kinase [Magnetovibrio sp.]|nr:dTMP kinase [Magnetovibrio sp.]
MSMGTFITLEGGEGTGKSTQTKHLVSALSAAGHKCLATREPGGCLASEEIRHLLVEGAADRWLPMTEVLLHNAARFEHLTKIIKPALSHNKIVISDRYFDSTMAYQGYGNQLDIASIANLHFELYKDFVPDLTLILNLPLNQGLERAKRRSGGDDRYENMNKNFHKRLINGFLEIAQKEPERCAVIDASGDEETVHHKIMIEVSKRLNLP